MLKSRLPQTSDQIALQAHTAHKHARKCKKDLRECVECQANIKWFGKLPLSTLSQVLRG